MRSVLKPAWLGLPLKQFYVNFHPACWKETDGAWLYLLHHCQNSMSQCLGQSEADVGYELTGMWRGYMQSSLACLLKHYQTIQTWVPAASILLWSEWAVSCVFRNEYSIVESRPKILRWRRKDDAFSKLLWCQWRQPWSVEETKDFICYAIREDQLAEFFIYSLFCINCS